MRLRAFLFSLLLFLPTGQSAAVEVHGLYEAEVPVADQGRPARQDAILRALSRVLVKVSGTGDAGLGQPIDANEAARYVQQYRYRQRPPEPDAPTAGEQLALWVRFDAQSIDQLLRQQGRPVWGSARPLTLVWLAVEEEGRRELVGANDGGVAREVLAEAGERRGLPVRLPLLDLTDQARVRLSDIWGDFHRPILEVSERYGPQAVLVGRLFPLRGTLWAVRWSLYQGERSYRWEAEGENIEALLASGVEGAADRLSIAFARTPDALPGDGALDLVVSGITDLAGFRRAVEYLTELNVVTSVEAVEVDPERVRFRLHTEGGTERLMNTLSLGDTLAPDEASEPQLQVEQGIRRALLYRLVP